MKAPHRGLSIYCPGETVGPALVTSFVLRFDRERVTALAQARVSLAARAGTEGAAIQLAQEAHPRLCVGEAEAGARLVRRVRRIRRDRRCRRRCGVNRPGVTDRTALVADSILRLHRKDVAALSQRASVGHRARAGTESAAIQLAQEGHPRLRVAEAEAGAGLVRRVSWLRGDRWCRRQRGVDRPGETVGAALVTSFVLRFDRERVTALAQARVSLAARAGTEGAAIQLAQEAHPRLCVGEAEAGARLVRRVRRIRRDRRCRRRCGVNRPGVTDRTALVADSILRLHRKDVAALSQRASVGHRARAGTESAAIQLAQESHPRLRVAEAEAGAGVVPRVDRARGDGSGRWRRRVDGPGETGGTGLVASFVLRLNRERVTALAQARVGPATRAGTEG